MKWFIGLLLVAGLAAGGWWWYSHSTNEKAPAYETTEVTTGDITVSVSATGTLNPEATVLVGSQVSGRIQELFADFNSVVKAGQKVAQLEPSPFTTKVRQNEATLAKAKASVALAKATLTRQKALIAQKLVSDAELDDAQAKYDQAVAEEMQAQASLDSAKIDLEHATIFSPVDGVVLTRSVDVGQTVAASLQAPTLFTIATDLTKMQIDANVDEADVGQVAVDQPVSFTVDAFPDRTFGGKVKQVRNSPQIVQNVVTYDTVISVDNGDLKLKPGMTANVTIVVNTRLNVLRLANAALRFKPPETAGATPGAPKSSGAAAGSGESRGAGRMSGGGGFAGGGEFRGGGRGSGGPGGFRPGGGGGEGRGGWSGRRRSGQVVYVLRDDKLTAVPVKTGLTDGSFTEVIEGLKEGDKVVTGLASAKPAAAASAATVNPFAPPRFPGGGRGGPR